MMYTVYTGINPVLVAVHPRLAGAAACLRGAAAAPAAGAALAGAQPRQLLPFKLDLGPLQSPGHPLQPQLPACRS